MGKGAGGGLFRDGVLGAVERKETAPTWPKGRQISMWEGAKVWVEWSTLKILCLFLSLRVGVEKIEKTALSMT